MTQKRGRGEIKTPNNKPKEKEPPNSSSMYIIFLINIQLWTGAISTTYICSPPLIPHDHPVSLYLCYSVGSAIVSYTRWAKKETKKGSSASIIFVTRNRISELGARNLLSLNPPHSLSGTGSCCSLGRICLPHKIWKRRTTTKKER